MPTTLVNDPSTMSRTPNGGGALFFHTLTPDSVGVCTLLRFQLPDGTETDKRRPPVQGHVMELGVRGWIHACSKGAREPALHSAQEQWERRGTTPTH